MRRLCSTRRCVCVAVAAAAALRRRPSKANVRDFACIETCCDVRGRCVVTGGAKDAIGQNELLFSHRPRQNLLKACSRKKKPHSGTLCLSNGSSVFTPIASSERAHYCIVKKNTDAVWRSPRSRREHPLNFDEAAPLCIPFLWSACLILPHIPLPARLPTHATNGRLHPHSVHPHQALA